WWRKRPKLLVVSCITLSRPKLTLKNYTMILHELRVLLLANLPCSGIISSSRIITHLSYHCKQPHFVRPIYNGGLCKYFVMLSYSIC
uniref:Uncharacterized protein n=1 Tax=Aegilops tauschii subsp. strangulata TaxID=200361 RepID=A0A453P7E4_AEGTS